MPHREIVESLELFGLTVIESHSARELSEMQQVLVNGVLWLAVSEILATGTPNQIEKAALGAMQTPRESKKPATVTVKKC